MSASLLVKFLSISYHKKPFREPNACDLRLLKRFCPRRRGAALKTVAAMARRKRRLAPQRNHTDSVITFYNRDTEKARDKMGNKTKKFRQISTKAHRTGHRGKNKRTRSAARGREKAVHLLLKPQRRSNCHTARGREKAGQISEEPPCCARTAQNGAATLRCLMRSGALPREGTFAVSLCAGCPPVVIR